MRGFVPDGSQPLSRRKCLIKFVFWGERGVSSNLFYQLQDPRDALVSDRRQIAANHLLSRTDTLQPAFGPQQWLQKVMADVRIDSVMEE